AGSATDASTVFAGGAYGIYKSGDGGATWSAANFDGIVASLVIHPRDQSIAYAAGEGYDYLGDYPGSLGKSVDGGVSWHHTGPETVDNVFAVGVDPLAAGTVYAAIGPYLYGGGTITRPDLLRSEDGGDTWTSASSGLPGVNVRALAVDPRVSG